MVKMNNNNNIGNGVLVCGHTHKHTHIIMCVWSDIIKRANAQAMCAQPICADKIFVTTLDTPGAITCGNASEIKEKKDKSNELSKHQ